MMVNFLGEYNEMLLNHALDAQKFNIDLKIQTL
jgi:hypothetical protein